MQLLHSLEEDDALSAGRQTPHRKSSRTKSQEMKGGEAPSSLTTSPKTPSHYSNASPPHRLSARDVNGSIKSSPVDDISGGGGGLTGGGAKDEEISLLPRR